MLKLTGPFFYSTMLSVGIAICCSRTLKDVWFLALENSNCFVKSLTEAMLNELKPRNKNDKLTFSRTIFWKWIIYVASISNFVLAIIDCYKNSTKRYLVSSYFGNNGQRIGTLIQIVKYDINGPSFYYQKINHRKVLLRIRTSDEISKSVSKLVAFSWYFLQYLWQNLTNFWQNRIFNDMFLTNEAFQ